MLNPACQEENVLRLSRITPPTNYSTFGHYATTRAGRDEASMYPVTILVDFEQYSSEKTRNVRPNIVPLYGNIPAPFCVKEGESLAWRLGDVNFEEYLCGGCV